MERESSSRLSSRNRVRGWYGLGPINSMSIICGPEPLEVTGAGAAAVAAPEELMACGSGSRISAPSPFPKAFLGMGRYLLGKLDVGFGPSTTNVVDNDGLPVARCLRQSYIARNHGRKDLRTEETPQVRCY